MPTIYVVRHCKAEGQAPDAPLTADGVKAANRLQSFFADKPLDAVISSPYERAYRSIAPLAHSRGLSIRVDERLKERVLSGDSSPDWRDRLRKTYDDLDICYEGGESSREAMKRAVGVVEECLQSGCSHMLLVSHGNLISLLLRHFDPLFGYKEWEALTNPDVYELCISDGAATVRRIWSEG
ncbi:MAG: Phosphoglycerate mutase [Paenibacillus sp.]|nr:Phosphoglycerate mutase [Paenibacillus sp.]